MNDMTCEHGFLVCSTCSAMDPFWFKPPRDRTPVIEELKRQVAEASDVVDSFREELANAREHIASLEAELMPFRVAREVMAAIQESAKEIAALDAECRRKSDPL